MSEERTIHQQSSDALYSRLVAKFDHTFTDIRGGVELSYVTGEQVITRLNEVLGFNNWSFRVLEHGVDEDEIWVLGELSITIDDRAIIRQQFGSDKIKRSRQTGTPLDIGFNYMGAATTALKKTATLIGVGLYLSEKEGGRPKCQDCGVDLEPIRLKGDRVATVAEQIERSRTAFGVVTCMACGASRKAPSNATNY